MKVMTYEDWMKNPTPRMMWVWDDDEACKEKMRVIYFLERNVLYPVIALDDEDDADVCWYRHCAEIAKTRRMTNKELSRWLRENPTREYKRSIRTDIVVNGFYSYIEEDADQEVDDTILIRENDSEWREPLIEVE